MQKLPSGYISPANVLNLVQSKIISGMHMFHCLILDAGTPATDKPSSRASGGKSSGGQGNISPTPHTLLAVPKRHDEFDGRYV